MKTLEDLEVIRKNARRSISIRCGEQQASIVVSMGRSMSENRRVISAVLEGLRLRGMVDVAVVQSAFTEGEEILPSIEVIRPGGSGTKYDGVTPEAVQSIIDREIVSANS